MAYENVYFIWPASDERNHDRNARGRTIGDKIVSVLDTSFGRYSTMLIGLGIFSMFCIDSDNKVARTIATSYLKGMATTLGVIFVLDQTKIHTHTH